METFLYLTLWECFLGNFTHGLTLSLCTVYNYLGFTSIIMLTVVVVKFHRNLYVYGPQIYILINFLSEL